MIEINEVTGTDKMKDSLDIRKKVFVIEQKVPLDFEMDGLDDKCVHFVLYVDHKPVVTCRLRRVDTYLKLERVATLKEYRKQGLAKKLMEYIQDYAEKKHPDLSLKTHAQVAVQPFYEKLGWQVKSAIFYEADIAHVFMLFGKG